MNSSESLSRLTVATFPAQEETKSEIYLWTKCFATLPSDTGKASRILKWFQRMKIMWEVSADTEGLQLDDQCYMKAKKQLESIHCLKSSK